MSQLLKEVSPEKPCGEDIAYDPEFLQLERQIVAGPESQFAGPSEEPNWKEIQDGCEAMFARSKHLRVAIFLTVAMMRQKGFPGLRDGLGLVFAMIEKYWDSLYPQLDAEENNDPTERMNIMASISAAMGGIGGDDPLRFRQRLLMVPLTNSRQMGRFSMRDVLVAAGEVPAPAGVEASKLPTLAVVQAAFTDTAIEELQATSQALTDTADKAKAILALLDQKAGASRTPDLSGFQGLMKHASKQVQQALARRGYGAPAADAAEGAPGAAAAAGQGAAAGGAPGEVSSTQDVLKTLDKICEFYERHEPSSPVPLLIRRARRLVGKSFVDIMRDMSPDALKQIEVISGASETGQGAPAAGA